MHVLAAQRGGPAFLLFQWLGKEGVAAKDLVQIAPILLKIFTPSGFSPGLLIQAALQAGPGQSVGPLSAREVEVFQQATKDLLGEFQTALFGPGGRVINWEFLLTHTSEQVWEKMGRTWAGWVIGPYDPLLGPTRVTGQSNDPYIHSTDPDRARLYTPNAQDTNLLNEVGNEPLVPACGILIDRTTGQRINIQNQRLIHSGVQGPAQSMGGAHSGFDAYARTHVEGHTAAYMRQHGIMEGVLYINRPPCGSCHRNLQRMLLPGARLTIIWQVAGGFVSVTYTGLPANIQIIFPRGYHPPWYDSSQPDGIAVGWMPNP